MASQKFILFLVTENIFLDKENKEINKSEQRNQRKGTIEYDVVGASVCRINESDVCKEIKSLKLTQQEGKCEIYILLINPCNVDDKLFDHIDLLFRESSAAIWFQLRDKVRYVAEAFLKKECFE